MPLDAQRPLLDFAELDAVANHGMVIEGHGLAQTGDIVRHLFSQPGDVRGQFVDASDMPIEARVDLLEALVVCRHPLGDLANLLADRANLFGELAHLPGNLGQQLIDGCDIGAVDTAHITN